MGSNTKSVISFPNYKTIAKAHKISYLRIDNNKDTVKKIHKVLNNNKPYICELMISPSQEQMPKAINRRTKSGKTVATTYEDMHPFLPRKEIINNQFENFFNLKGD